MTTCICRTCREELESEFVQYYPGTNDPVMIVNACCSFDSEYTQTLRVLEKRITESRELVASATKGVRTLRQLGVVRNIVSQLNVLKETLTEAENELSVLLNEEHNVKS